MDIKESIPTPEATTPERELSENGVYASITRGVSMRPLFKTHRDVIIVRTPTRPLKKYDVVLYKVGDKYVLHRIIGKKDGVFIIRGDNTYTREYVEEGKILALLTEFNRGGKRHSVEETSFKIYSRVWNFIYPVRYLLQFFRRAVRKVFRVVFKKKKRTET